MRLIEEISITKTGNDDYIVENKLNNTHIKMGEREVNFLRSFSKQYDLNEECNFSEEEKEYLEKSFIKLKLIKDENNSNELKRSKFSSFKRLDISKIKIHTFNPDKLFEKISPIANKLITKQAVLVYSIIILTALCLGIYNIKHLKEVTQNIIQEMNMAMFITFYILMIVTIFIHEFFHGVTCKKYTNTVKEMGIMLFYLQPAMYCNVSSVYLLKDKKKRVIIFSSGIFSQLVLSAIAIIVYFCAFELGYKHTVLIYYSLSNIALAIYNLIPFIKLDGYWILSAILGVENFREKSINLVLSFLSKQDIKERYEEKKLVLFLYGVSAIIFTSSLWIALIMQAHNYTSVLNNKLSNVIYLIIVSTVIIHFIKILKIKINYLFYGEVI